MKTDEIGNVDITALVAEGTHDEITPESKKKKNKGKFKIPAESSRRLQIWKSAQKIGDENRQGVDEEERSIRKKFKKIELNDEERNVIEKNVCQRDLRGCA